METPHSSEKKKFLIKTILTVLSCLYLQSCSTSLTREARKVRPINNLEKDKYSCRFIEVITGSHSSGFSAAGNQESAMNDVRNQVAHIGGNAYQILTSDGGNFLDPSASFNAEVLNCKFKD